MIRLSGLHKSYATGANSLHVLKGIDLEIPEGEMVAIMGSSGSGKSTLLNVLGILDGYDAGEYRLGDERVWRLSESRAAQLRNRMLGFVFQSFNLIPFKTAVENVALPLYYQGVRRKRRNALALELLERVGLGAWGDHLPNQLSGGQQQRVAIARALITAPRVILADEPTGALDSATSMEVMEVLRGIHRAGTTVVLVTHEHDIAALAERVIRLHDGVIGDDRKQATPPPAPTGAPPGVVATPMAEAAP